LSPIFSRNSVLTVSSPFRNCYPYYPTSFCSLFFLLSPTRDCFSLCPPRQLSYPSRWAKTPRFYSTLCSPSLTPVHPSLSPLLQVGGEDVEGNNSSPPKDILPTNAPFFSLSSLPSPSPSDCSTPRDIFLIPLSSDFRTKSLRFFPVSTSSPLEKG